MEDERRITALTNTRLKNAVIGYDLDPKLIVRQASEYHIPLVKGLTTKPTNRGGGSKRSKRNSSMITPEIDYGLKSQLDTRKSVPSINLLVSRSDEKTPQ